MGVSHGDEIMFLHDLTHVLQECGLAYVESMRWTVVKQLLTPASGSPSSALGIRSLTQSADVSMPTAVNRLSYPWHRKDPRVHEHARPKTHLQDLRAKVAGLYVRFVVGVVPPTEAARHLGGDKAGAVAQLERDCPSLVARAQTDGNFVAHGDFVLARGVVSRSHWRTPYFSPSNAHRWRVRLTRGACSLDDWWLMTTWVQETLWRLLLLGSWRKRLGVEERKQ